MEEPVEPVTVGAVEAGLLLRYLNEVTILGKPYYLLYIPIMVT